MSIVRMTKSPLYTAPTGLTDFLPTTFPTLKRGANHHCAYGAVKNRDSLFNSDSCDCPA
jgi:hypothetical protein